MKAWLLLPLLLLSACIENPFKSGGGGDPEAPPELIETPDIAEVSGTSGIFIQYFFDIPGTFERFVGEAYVTPETEYRTSVGFQSCSRHAVEPFSIRVGDLVVLKIDINAPHPDVDAFKIVRVDYIAPHCLTNEVATVTQKNLIK